MCNTVLYRWHGIEQVEHNTWLLHAVQNNYREFGKIMRNPVKTLFCNYLLLHLLLFFTFTFIFYFIFKVYVRFSISTQ